MARSVPEWRGKTHDTPVPPRVRLRIFDRHGGICHISGRKIRAGEQWDCDHVIALALGGEHREYNLAPALRELHRAKTAQDVAQKSRIYRKRRSHLGIKKLGKPIPGSKRSKFKKKLDGSVVRRTTGDY